jgi:hypothetical protein
VRTSTAHFRSASASEKAGHAAPQAHVSSKVAREKAPATEVEWESNPLGEWPRFSVCFVAGPAAKDVTDVVYFETVRAKVPAFVFPIRRSQRRCGVGRDHEIRRSPSEAHPFLHFVKIQAGKGIWWRDQVEDSIEIRRCDGSLPNSVLPQNELDREILLPQFRGDR